VTRPAPSPIRRRRILDAAEKLFSRMGFRAVTMARVAEEAGLAKATVYAYFADKDDLFRAVAEDVAERVALALERALEGEGDTTTRLVRALVAKDSLIWELVAGSPFAGELFAARDRLVRHLFDALDRRILAAVAAALADGVERGLPPARLARLVVRASRGLATRADGLPALAQDIEILVRRLVGPPRA
jgi:AcrR family transcriptional regulator